MSTFYQDNLVILIIINGETALTAHLIGSSQKMPKEHSTAVAEFLIIKATS